MSGDNPYAALSEDHGGTEPGWAFGTGFVAAPLDADAPVPPGVDADDLSRYCCMLADDALVMSQRLIQWCTSAPELEEEVALANIALDLLGQARPLLARAGRVDGSGRDEDALAFFRDAPEFRNVRLVEAPNGDFARSTARLFVFSTWRLALFDRLRSSADPVLAAVAAKGVNELAYHREYAAGWVIRLGDGTPLSRERMAAGLAEVWPDLGELFAVHPVEARLVDGAVAADPAGLRVEVLGVVEQVVREATLRSPGPVPPAVVAGRDGQHSGELASLLAEMQAVARAHPGASW
ncbi:1,2-phenylacetyl-CoA epoxidase subunit PaaC [Marinactinospora thermotolerans]|uniref:Ring-1,2-phenylacetyl-CoA epoxidase subunit PaaC n=1 Tax=Marinactinospora thermotolerans DSM 45154 TaxID=1122192 RepID=A0A1T4JWM5_9ACTN|nr:1,2-phenylacetyl-CoA epoxidase subunit PaaC [Marinactinospora thermotolerans]SJZ34561.1 ring-1,2-phenylacetyl-CoA epoxidase subunit PaaC [Marinactinospora thermotolerans DSM 45154]